METKHAVEALAALAHPARLAVFRLLMQAGPQGLPAGRIAQAMSLPPSSLSFHLKELQHAGLLDSQQQGRSILYMARYETMNALLVYLTDDCCGGNPCTPVAIRKTPARATRQAAKPATKAGARA
ncbi:helix-turn-helix transcriptional regulator [Cupriavidus sp. AU9028]|uniref:ArsR/SmtB family transcription factor n=1 Tax=Cupriavidus sp. AU9028 TaxID=2871157 RepID=UPI001C93EFBF|nr:metalloregulator ArsR/SmtB family transcription factor [Cupriavidus sp. AU9028]MBY4897211.1 metalloregulator ArsR/SmtB family transcription factor [Cupriavidus sp. AU9028]